LARWIQVQGRHDGWIVDDLSRVDAAADDDRVRVFISAQC
jgi:hypothetical protein